MENIITKALDTVAPKEDNLDAVMNEYKYRVLYQQFIQLTNGRVLKSNAEHHMIRVLSGKQKILNLVSRFKGNTSI